MRLHLIKTSFMRQHADNDLVVLECKIDHKINKNKKLQTTFKTH